PSLETHGVRRIRVFRQVIDEHFIESARQLIDRVDRAQQLTVFTPRHFTRHEDAQVTDARVPQVNDCATGILQGEIAGIDVGDPVQRLLWRGDVVAIGAEHYHRHFD